MTSPDEIDIDPYLLWLGIRDSKRPPNYYSLLGLSLYERNPEVIAKAAQLAMARVNSLGREEYPELADRVTSEIQAASSCLLVDSRRNDYEEGLRSEAGDSAPENATIPEITIGNSSGSARGSSRIRSSSRSSSKRTKRRSSSSGYSYSTRKKKKSWLPWLAGPAVLLVGVAALWFFVLRDKDSFTNNKTDNTDSGTHALLQDPDPVDLEGYDNTNEALPPPPERNLQSSIAEQQSDQPTAQDRQPTDNRNAAAPPQEKTARKPGWPLDRPSLFPEIDRFRGAVARRDLAGARRAINLARKTAKSSTEKAVVDRWAAINDQIDLFWRTVERSLMNLGQGDELLWQGQVARVSGTELNSITVDLPSGESKTFSTTRQEIDPELATALLETELQSSVPAAWLAAATFWSTDRRGDLTTGNKYWSLASQQGLQYFVWDELFRDPNQSAGGGAQVTEVSKLPVPSKAERVEATKIVRRLFPRQFSAKDSDSRASLARELLRVASETLDSDANRYVLYEQAILASLDGNDPDLSARAIGEMSSVFEVDPWDLKLGYLRKLAKQATTDATFYPAFETMTEFAQDADREFRFDIATKVFNAAGAVAKRLKKVPEMRAAQKAKGVSSKLDQLYKTARPALEQLKESPEDESLNRTAGMFLSLGVGDFDRGNRMLAKCSGGPISQLAKDDVTTPTDGPAQKSLGDRWLELSESLAGLEKMRATERAIYWYESSLPALSGTTKIEVKQSIESLADKTTGSKKARAYALKFDRGFVLLPNLFYRGEFPLTVEAMVWHDGTSSPVTQAIVSNSQSSGIILGARRGKWHFIVHSDSKFEYATSDKSIEPNTWVHLAGVANESEVVLFVNGKRQATAPRLNGHKKSDLPLMIGADPNKDLTPEKFYSGLIREVRVSSGVKYTSDFRAPNSMYPEKDTLLLTKLDEGRGNRAMDSSGKQHHGTIRRAEWVPVEH